MKDFIHGLNPQNYYSSCCGKIVFMDRMPLRFLKLITFIDQQFKSAIYSEPPRGHVLNCQNTKHMTIYI